MNGKCFLLSLASPLLLSCVQGNGDQNDSISLSKNSSMDTEVDGGAHTFTAASLPRTPKETEEEMPIDGHIFICYNVYNDGEGNFVLKDDTSYIKNYSLCFGLRFAKGLARAYDISENKDGQELCQLLHEGENEQYYSVSGGFEIAIDKSLSSHHYDENIGKITHWC